jgi:hypothetical protein
MQQTSSGTSEHEAVERLFELARNGDIDNREFHELDCLVQQGLLEAYGIADSMQPADSHCA